MYHIGGVNMKFPLIVGAGASKTVASLDPYMREDVSIGAITLGSITPEFRLGNDGVLFWPSDYAEFQRLGFGLNSFGMPNAGFDDVAKQLQSAYIHPIIVSVAGFRVDHYVKGIEVFDRHPAVAAVKFNFGCPNTDGIPIAYSIDSLEQILHAVDMLKPTKPVWLKLSPYITAAERDELQNLYPELDFSNVPVTSPEFLGHVMALVFYCRFVRAVVFSNTLGNVIHRDQSGKPVTSPFGGKAGLSGSILRPINIKLIQSASTMVSGYVSLIASGGIESGYDAVEFLEHEANAVCCTSGPFWSGNGPRFFADTLSGSERLQNYLMQHSQSRED